MTKRESQNWLEHYIDQVEDGNYKVNDKMVEQLSKYSRKEVENDWDIFETIVRNNG